MNKLMEVLAMTGNKMIFSVKKNSPTILLVTGIVSIVGGTVSAVAVTKKAANCLDEFNERMERYNQAIENANKKEDPEEFYSQEDRKKDIRVIYGTMIKTMAKLYVKAFVLETLGIVLICKSHGSMVKRNAGLLAMNGALLKQNDEYRRRVAELIGEDPEKELYLGAKSEKIIETDENGETTETENVTVDPLSPFSFFIDETCDRVWDKDPYETRRNLQSVLRQLNDMAYYKPFVTLNDLYWLVGHPLTDDGLVYGWRGGKDAHIDLGLFDGSKEATRRFINGLENVVLVTPNIDGNIYQMSKNEKRRRKHE